MPNDVTIATNETNINIGSVRVIIELSATGALTIESYSNGQRTKVPLNRGQEYWEILDELKMLQRRARTEAERKADAQGKSLRLRHNRVWINTAERFGLGFANDKIGGTVPPGYGQYFAPAEQKQKPVPKALPDIAELL